MVCFFKPVRPHRIFLPPSCVCDAHTQIFHSSTSTMNIKCVCAAAWEHQLNPSLQSPVTSDPLQDETPDWLQLQKAAVNQPLPLTAWM